MRSTRHDHAATWALPAAAEPQAVTMTIGTLSRRTGVSVKTLRAYEDMGLIYTLGRSPGNYRLFGEEALWCVGVVSGLRTLGLTLEEIRDLASAYLQPADDPAGLRPRCCRRCGPGPSSASPSFRSA